MACSSDTATLASPSSFIRPVRVLVMKTPSRLLATFGAALLLALMSFSASAETVLITGADQGIGFEFARQYAARGWTVVATHRRDKDRKSSWR